MTAETAAYGTWTSPVTAAEAARNDGGPGWPGYVGEEIWWTESRPAEGGRSALLRRRVDGSVLDVLDVPWNVRSRVHEYGGRSWTAAPDPVSDGQPLLVFSNFADQRLYRHTPDAPGAAGPVPLTPAPDRPAGLRYIEPQLHLDTNEVWCIREEFHGEAPTDLNRSLVAVPLDGSAAENPSAVRQILTDGRFLACPRLSPDGRRLAWLSWDHPNMPWDGTTLRIADHDPAKGITGEPRTVAGGPAVSVCQVEWDGPGRLLISADPDGWWNLYHVDLAPDGSAAEPVGLLPAEEEFGGPLWTAGSRWFSPLPSGRIAVLHGLGSKRLSVLDPVSGELHGSHAEYTVWAPALDVRGSAVLGIAGSPERSFEVVELETNTGYLRVIGSAHQDTVDPAHLPVPEFRTFGETGSGQEVHVNLYPPHNPGFAAPAGELAPYVIWAHGGPTGNAPMLHDLGIAYFTSRGIGVADVNYGGSTGFGRAYRERLRGTWGEVDVRDCARVARALIGEGLADPERLAIRGGSAGGFTSAAALTSDAPEVVGLFRCAAIYFPVLDLAEFASGGTHDFESRYLESLIGRLPEDAARFAAYSPNLHADRLTAPFVLLQGSEDEVCPPSQARQLLQAVSGRGIPHAYREFAGEQHGFRREETLIEAMETEISLYGQVFGFVPVGVEPVELVK